MTKGEIYIFLWNSCTKFVWVEAIQFKQLPMAPENIEVVEEVDFFIPQGLFSHLFSPNSHENMFVSLAGSGPLMND